MNDQSVLRVVVAKRGQVKPNEFRLREGEIGLSLFRSAPAPGPDAILEAVRAAGKQGELIVVEIPVRWSAGWGWFSWQRRAVRLIRT